jgi:uncharacterized membrane protein
LFFPGYALVKALFADEMSWKFLRFWLSVRSEYRRHRSDRFCPNFTAWGIRLEPVLYSLAAFIALAAIAAYIRGAGFLTPYYLRLNFKIGLPGWGGSTLHDSLAVLLIGSVLAALGILGYNLAAVSSPEKYTEFYVLGINGQAADYPVEFLMQNNQAVLIRYGSNDYYLPASYGEVIAGIVNHEQQTASYFLKIQVNGDPVELWYEGNVADRLSPVELPPGGKWEHKVGFAPQYIGDGQTFEIFLYKNGAPLMDDTLRLLINAREMP